MVSTNFSSFPTVPVLRLDLKDTEKTLYAKISSRDSDSFFLHELESFDDLKYCELNDCQLEYDQLANTFGLLNNDTLHQNISVTYVDFTTNNASDYFWFYRSNFTLNNDDSLSIYNYSFALIEMTSAADKQNTSLSGYYNQLSFNPSNQNASINLKSLEYYTLFDQLYTNNISQNSFLSIQFDKNRENGTLTLDNKSDFYSKDYITTDLIPLSDYYYDYELEGDDSVYYKGNFVKLAGLQITHGIIDYDENFRLYQIPIYKTSSDTSLLANVDIDYYPFALPSTHFNNILSFYQATYNDSYDSYTFDCNLFNGEKDFLSVSIDGQYLNESETDSATYRRYIELPLSNFVTIETNVTTHSNTTFKDYAIFQTKTCYFDSTKFTESTTDFAILGQVILSSLKFAYDFDKQTFSFGQLYNDTHYSTIKYI